MRHLFREFELDEERFELRRDGQTIRVEPRVLEVLAYLIRNRGRVVTKEELLDQVWKKSFVSDSALTRCIMEARRAIGDPARAVPLIKTVHGRGYRFDIVEPVVEDGPIADATPAEALEAPAIVMPVVAETPARPSYRNAAILAAILVAAVLGWLSFRRNAQAAPGNGRTVTVALLPISIASDDRELHMVGMSMADLLEQRLGRVQQLRVRSADYSRPISVSATNLVEVSRRASSPYIISGSVRRTERADQVRLTFSMHHVSGEGSVRDTPLGTFDVPLLRRSEDIASYAALRDRIVSHVVATVLPAFELEPGAGATPRDFASYRLYLLARERLAAGGCDGEAAIELLRRSLEIDARYAPAWDAFGWALYQLSSDCTAGSQHHQLALEAADRALALAPGMGSAVSLKARIIADSGKVEEAYALVRNASRNAPANLDLERAQFVLLARAGYLDAAERHLQRVVSTDPTELTEHGTVPTPYLYAGNVDRFLRTTPAAGAPVFRYARGFAELMANRPDAAYRILEPSFRTNPADAYARMSHALLAIIEGRHAEARAIVRHFVRQRELVGERDGELTYRIAELAALAGDDALALAQLGRAIDQGFFCVVLIERDPAMVSIRNLEEYGRLLERARRRQAAFGARFAMHEGAATLQAAAPGLPVSGRAR